MKMQLLNVVLLLLWSCSLFFEGGVDADPLNATNDFTFYPFFFFERKTLNNFGSLNSDGL